MSNGGDDRLCVNPPKGFEVEFGNDARLTDFCWAASMNKRGKSAVQCSYKPLNIYSLLLNTTVYSITLTVHIRGDAV